MKNKKEKIENWEKEFEKLWYDPENKNPLHYWRKNPRAIKTFIKNFILITQQSEKEKLLEKIKLKKWERTKRRDVIATEMDRIMCETRNNTIKELEKLKEEIKK